MVTPPEALRGAAALVVATVVLTGCASSASGAPPGGQAGAAGLPYGHVHGLGVDPADGAVYVATHDGLFRADAGGLRRADTTGRDLMGFTITGPGTFLSSGHPGPGEQVANPLGLVQSTDTGTSWTTLALAGEVDFHALEVSAGTVFGYDATHQVLRASDDGGRTWHARAALRALDIAADPANPAALLATVQGGVAASRDSGRTFAAPPGRSWPICPGRATAPSTASIWRERSSSAATAEPVGRPPGSCPAGARRHSPPPTARCSPPPRAGCTAPTTAASPSHPSPDRRGW